MGNKPTAEFRQEVVRVALTSGLPRKKVERLMRLHDDVMRILTIKVDEHDAGPSVQMQKREERGERRERRA